MSSVAPALDVDQEMKEAVEGHHKDLKGQLEKLENEQTREHQLALKLKRWGVGLMTLGVALIVAAIICGSSALELAWAPGLRFGLGVSGALATVLAIGLSALAFDHQTEERRLNVQIRRLRFECGLLQLQPGGGECRAEKLLGNNDAQLRSYYELNIEQCAKIFWVGIFCLFAGVVVIAVTLWAVHKSRSETYAQVIIGAVGAVGNILINYVAAMFLKMHSELLTILKDFQSKLVDTQELYLANVLASRINEAATREDTLKELSLAMVQGERINRCNGARKTEAGG